MSPFLRLRGAHLTSHPVLEDLVFTLLSLAVAVVAITAVASPPEATLAANVNASGVNVNPKQIVFYGTLVDAGGVPISGADIDVMYSDGTRAARARTAKDGSWSTQFVDGPGPYTVVVTVTQNGVTTTSSIDITAEPGKRYGVQMTYAPPSSWVFVPVPGY